jgi:hypothetical protein
LRLVWVAEGRSARPPTPSLRLPRLTLRVRLALRI